jgi:hypothetical protein
MLLLPFPIVLTLIGRQIMSLMSHSLALFIWMMAASSIHTYRKFVSCTLTVNQSDTVILAIGYYDGCGLHCMTERLEEKR